MTCKRKLDDYGYLFFKILGPELTLRASPSLNAGASCIGCNKNTKSLVDAYAMNVVCITKNKKKPSLRRASHSKGVSDFFKITAEGIHILQMYLIFHLHNRHRIPPQTP